MGHKLRGLFGLSMVFILVLAAVAWADQPDDETLIREAVLNYVNAIYEVNPKLLEKSVSPKLQKVGYVPKSDGSGYREMWMSVENLKTLAAHYNQDGGIDPATAPRTIVILDKSNQRPVVRLDAVWGIDFIELVREGDKWMILNVIWQTYPEE